MGFTAKAMTFILLGGAVLSGGLPPQEAPRQVKVDGRSLPVYPRLLEEPPGIASPCVAEDGTELVTARTKEGRYALVDVTVPDWNRVEVRYFGDSVLAADAADFPSLARTGLHKEAELAGAMSINGRPIAEINEAARPGRLSTDGFLAEDEDVLSVLLGDDRLARTLGLTHPLLAKPLLHLWNLILQEQKSALGAWSGGPHAWVHFDHFLYNGRRISYQAHFTKGGQKSPFGDGFDGGAHVFLRREMEPAEAKYLEARYRRLGPQRIAALKTMLSGMTSGEMEPFYIVRYGFYEGHTPWRVDPIAIASIFGLRSLEEIERAFPGKLADALFSHHVRPK